MLGHAEPGSFAIPQVDHRPRGPRPEACSPRLRHDRGELLGVAELLRRHVPDASVADRCPALAALYDTDIRGELDVPQAHLTNAREHHAGWRRSPRQRMVYVAGSNRPTPCGIKDIAYLSAAAYETTLAGDGRVTHELGRLELAGAMSDVLRREAHGDLPANQEVLAALTELLAPGETGDLLMAPPSAKRSGTAAPRRAVAQGRRGRERLELLSRRKAVAPIAGPPRPSRRNASSRTSGPGSSAVAAMGRARTWRARPSRRRHRVRARLAPARRGRRDRRARACRRAGGRPLRRGRAPGSRVGARPGDQRGRGRRAAPARGAAAHAVHRTGHAARAARGAVLPARPAREGTRRRADRARRHGGARALRGAGAHGPRPRALLVAWTHGQAAPCDRRDRRGQREPVATTRSGLDPRDQARRHRIGRGRAPGALAGHVRRGGPAADPGDPRRVRGEAAARARRADRLHADREGSTTSPPASRRARRAVEEHRAPGREEADAPEPDDLRRRA